MLLQSMSFWGSPFSNLIYNHFQGSQNNHVFIIFDIPQLFSHNHFSYSFLFCIHAWNLFLFFFIDQIKNSFLILSNVLISNTPNFCFCFRGKSFHKHFEKCHFEILVVKNSFKNVNSFLANQFFVSLNSYTFLVVNWSGYHLFFESLTVFPDLFLHRYVLYNKFSA